MKYLPHWRKSTWAILIWTALFAFFLISGINNAANTPADCGTLSQEACDAAAGIGTGIGVTLLFGLWFIGFIVLSIIWFMSRPRGTLVEVYSPEGAKALTNEKEAKRLVTKAGYSYSAAGDRQTIKTQDGSTIEGPGTGRTPAS